MPRKRKHSNSGPVLSQKAWMAWKMYNDAASAEEAEESLREQADAAVTAGRMEVFREMLDVRGEFLEAARAEFMRADGTKTSEERTIARGMGNLFLEAARTLRRAAQLASLKAPDAQDERLLKVIEGGID